MQIVNINLSENKKEVLILLKFCHGYANENNSDFGLAHLTEHYIIAQLEKKYKTIDIDGTIDDDSITVYLSLKNTEAEKIELTPKKILEDIEMLSQKIDPKILRNEKKRIEIELEEKYYDVFQEISHVIEKNIIYKPAHLKRHRMSQLNNLSKFTGKKVAKCILDIVKTAQIAFVGYSGNKNSSDKKIAETKNSKIILTKNKTFRLSSENRVLKKSSNFAIAFPLPKLKRPINKYYLEFFFEQLDSHFMKKIQALGIYKTEYQYNINSQGGYVWFFANSYKTIDRKIEDLFFETVEEVIKSKQTKIRFSSFKKEISESIKFDWKNFYRKFDFISGEYLEDASVCTIEKYLRLINSLQFEEMTAVIRLIFKKGKSIVGKK